MLDDAYVTIPGVPKRESPPSTAMRISAIRFGADLWQVLETEAAGVGVSVSQYVREAALMRIAATATARGEDPFQLLAEAGPNAAPAPPRPADDPAPLHGAGAEVAATRAVRATWRDWIDRAQAAVDAAQAALESALAVTAESEQARRQRKTRTSGQQRNSPEAFAGGLGGRLTPADGHLPRKLDERPDRNARPNP